MDKGLYVDIDDLADELTKSEIETEEKVVEAKVDAEPKKPDPAIENLTKERDATAAELAMERSRRELAEKLAAEKIGEAANLGRYATGTEYQLIVNAISSTSAEAENAEREYASAMEAGDYARAAKAQRVISKAEANLTRLEDGKAEIEVKAERMKQAPVETKKADQPTPKVQTADDYINALPAASKTWLSEHREYVEDPKLHKKLIAYSDIALAEGIKLHTPEHIQFLEDKLGISQPSEEPDESDADVEFEEPKQEAKPKARTMPAAPVSRGNKTFSSANPNGNRIRLSPTLVSLAKEMGEDPTVYAKNALRGIKEGKLPKNFLDPDYNHNV